MSEERDEILRTLALHKDSIRAFGARRLGLFGSHARGEASAKSDLDFLVEFEPGRQVLRQLHGPQGVPRRPLRPQG